MKISDNISWKKLQDKIVAVNLTSGAYYTMNEVAGRIWELLSEGKSPEETAETLAGEFDNETGEILKDVNEQLEYWQSEGLLDN